MSLFLNFIFFQRFELQQNGRNFSCTWTINQIKKIVCFVSNLDFNFNFSDLFLFRNVSHNQIEGNIPLALSLLESLQELFVFTSLADILVLTKWILTFLFFQKIGQQQFGRRNSTRTWKFVQFKNSWFAPQCLASWYSWITWRLETTGKTVSRILILFFFGYFFWLLVLFIISFICEEYCIQINWLELFLSNLWIWKTCRNCLYKKNTLVLSIFSFFFFRDLHSNSLSGEIPSGIGNLNIINLYAFFNIWRECFPIHIINNYFAAICKKTTFMGKFQNHLQPCKLSFFLFFFFFIVLMD